MKLKAITSFFTILSIAAVSDSQVSLTDSQATESSIGLFSNIPGIGARAMGMAGAFTAIADDATAATWNPAGLALLSQPEVSLVFESLAGSLDARDAQIAAFPSDDSVLLETLTLNDVFGDLDYDAPTFLSITHPFKINGHLLAAQLSARRLIELPEVTLKRRFRFERIDEGGPSFDLPYRDSTETRFSGGIDLFSLSAAYQPWKNLRVGVTLNYLDANYSFRRNLEFAFSDGLAEGSELEVLQESFHGWFADLGLQWDITEKWGFGAVYHTDFTADFDFRDTLMSTQSGIVYLGPAAARGSGRIRWPDSYALGIAFRPNDLVRVAVDFSQTSWSDAKRDAFVAAAFEFDESRNVFIPTEEAGVDLSYPNFDPQKDTRAVRLGGEYILNTTHFAIPFRAGFFAEKAMIGTFPDLEDDPRSVRGFTLGTGLTYDRYHFDLAWVHSESDETVASMLEDEELRLTVVVDGFTTETDRFIASLIVRF